MTFLGGDSIEFDTILVCSNNNILSHIMSLAASMSTNVKFQSFLLLGEVNIGMKRYLANVLSTMQLKAEISQIIHMEKQAIYVRVQIDNRIAVEPLLNEIRRKYPRAELVYVPALNGLPLSEGVKILQTGQTTNELLYIDIYFKQ